MIRNLENLAKVATVFGLVAFAGCKDSREEERPSVQNGSGTAVVDSYDEGAYMRAKTRRAVERMKRASNYPVSEGNRYTSENNSNNDLQNSTEKNYSALGGRNYNIGSRMNQPIIPGGHFTWSEATHGGRCIPGEKEIPQIIETAKYMEKVREKFADRAVHVNSWYRTPEYNKMIGGVDNSQHVKGRAVDFTVSGVSPSETYKTLDPFVKGGLGRYAGFIHVDRGEGKSVESVEKPRRWDETQINYAGLNTARTTARN